MTTKRMNKKLIAFILLAIFCLPSILPLFHPGFFQSDDGEWMIIRFSAFFQALSDGQFPVRFLGRLNHEYGYPVANFLYPGFMYLGVPIHILGIGFVDTIKIIFGFSMIGSAIFCYLWLSRFFDKLSSLVGALFYLYTPYHLFDLYKRGSIGEVLSLAVLPFILWQIERRSLFWSAISIAFLIISHNTLAVLFLPIIIIYKLIDLLLKKNKKYVILNTLYLILISLGLSAFFWIPAFLELQYTIFSQTQISEWGSYFADINLIGFSTIFVLSLTAVFMVSSIIKVKKHRLTLLLLIVGLVSVFFSSSLSTTLWNILPVSFIQFPFRFLSLSIVSVSFLIACVIYVSPSKLKIPIAVLSLIILVLSAKPFLTPSEFFDKGEGFYSTNMDTTTVKNEYMPKWVEQKPIERFKEKVEIVGGAGTVSNVYYNSKMISFNVSSSDNTKVRINTIYYTGWKALAYAPSCHPERSEGSLDCEGRELTIDYQNEKGLMELEVPKGNNKVKLNFSETPLRLFADLVSLFSFIALIFLVKTHLKLFRGGKS
ncbi:MAG: hypothetical protein A3B41_00085 [Candidatus Levybacteria bacterium RIFCSPLOWO2_01_FULL_37_26]|nr:MAG: hypothetical protein A3E40_01530 [Candidatus Levybacteria bacterium RIFCSPHIGHO2_12_FULL_37_9]OGH40313.1 MAG: hypothetical protein A3B41_00085 [Candidatus Levybacteria bacterium RIFCSPLOWO2_01_FULL_37_26]